MFVNVCVCTCTPWYMCEVTEQLGKVSSLLLPCEIPGSNTDPGLQKVSLLAEPSLSCPVIFFKFILLFIQQITSTLVDFFFFFF